MSMTCKSSYEKMELCLKRKLSVYSVISLCLMQLRRPTLVWFCCCFKLWGG